MLDRHDGLASLDGSAGRLVNRDHGARHRRADMIAPGAGLISLRARIEKTSFKSSAAEPDNLPIADVRAGEMDGKAADLDRLAPAVGRARRRDLVLTAVDADHEMGPASDDLDFMDAAIEPELERHDQFLQRPIVACGSGMAKA
jgi:hypothetical protein